VEWIIKALKFNLSMLSIVVEELCSVPTVGILNEFALLNKPKCSSVNAVTG
jgi:hypothetical protein